MFVLDFFSSWLPRGWLFQFIDRVIKIVVEIAVMALLRSLGFSCRSCRLVSMASPRSVVQNPWSSGPVENIEIL